MNNSDHIKKDNYYYCKNKNTAQMINASAKTSDFKASSIPSHSGKPISQPTMKSPASIIHPKYPAEYSLPIQPKKPTPNQATLYNNPAVPAGVMKNKPDISSSKANLTQKQTAQLHSQDDWWLNYDEYLSKILK